MKRKLGWSLIIVEIIYFEIMEFEWKDGQFLRLLVTFPGDPNLVPKPQLRNTSRGSRALFWPAAHTYARVHSSSSF